MKIGMLTGGGDCPGLNAVIRAVVRKGIFTYEDEFIGFMEGWRGLIDNTSVPLDLDAVGGILPRGGTILRTSRTNPSPRATAWAPLTWCTAANSAAWPLCARTRLSPSR
jgi:6-phosphofructokinase